MARQAVKKKAVAVIRKGSNAQLLAEEKHIGRETVDWSAVSNFEAAFRETLRHYGYFYDIKDGHKWAIEWVKQNYTKAKLADFKSAETWRVSMTVGSMCKMMLNGAQFDDKRMSWVREKLDEVIVIGNSNRKREKKVDQSVQVVNKRSPADIIKERTSDFIAEIEGSIDLWITGDDEFKVDEYSVYSELEKIAAAYNTAKAVSDYYTPLVAELQELTGPKPKSKSDDYDQLIEGYAHLTKAKQKEYLKLIKAIVSDAEKYMSSKKAVRKTRKPKAKSTAQIVSKVTYLTSSAEYKITSIDPSELIGAKVVWLFNVKTRDLTKIESKAPSGMTVKGTTIYDFEDDLCVKKKLRKPDEFLTVVAKTTKAKIDKEFKAIRTKEQPSNGRINADTIILKVYK